jgi:hypothetical protein
MPYLINISYPMSSRSHPPLIQPNMDGPEATKEIRALGYNHAPIIGVTGNTLAMDVWLRPRRRQVSRNSRTIVSIRKSVLARLRYCTIFICVPYCYLGYACTYLC